MHNFRNHLDYFVEKPHLTGQKRDRDISIFIAKSFKHLGLDVFVPRYNVLLSFPNFNENGEWVDGEDAKNEVSNLKYISEMILEVLSFSISLFVNCNSLAGSNNYQK